MLERVQPIRAAWMSCDENQLTICGTRRTELEVIVDLRRLAVFVRAEQADVEVVTGILEVVGIAAKKRDRYFRREHEPHVRVLFVAVEVIFSSLIERDDIAAQ